MLQLGRLDRRQFLGLATATTAASALPVKAGAQTGMLAREIPGTGEHLPIMGLGSPVVFYSNPPAGPELAQSLVRAMYDMGGRFIDTPAFFRPFPPGAAPPAGQVLDQSAEHLPALGPVLNELNLTDELFLAGKISVRGKEAGRQHMDKLSANLNKNPMDLMMVLNLTDVDNNWPTLKEAKAEGKVRYIGASLTNIRNVENFDRSPIEQFMQRERPDFFLLGYSMFQHEPEQRLLPLAQDLGIAIVAAEAFKTRTDGAYFSLTANKELPEWAQEFDCDSWAQFALKYVAAHPAVTTVITETSRVEHVVDNMSAGYGALPDAQMRTRMRAHFETLL